MSISADPSTASAPSWVAEPVRTPEPIRYFGHILHAERCSGARQRTCSRKIGDVFGRLHAADGADGDGFAALLDDGATSIGDVFGDYIGDFADR
jgi:hypothetical protein